jgi:signal peptidase I
MSFNAAAAPRSARTRLPGIGLVGIGVALIGTVIMVAAVVGFLLFQPVHVVGVTMAPALEANDLVLVDRNARAGAVGRGDIIVMRDPFNGSRSYIKRVIGLPGERVLIRGGKVYINDRELQEPYLSQSQAWTTGTDWPPTDSPWTVPRASFFVLGDNRDHSSDSRLFGPVPGQDLQGTARFRVWPPGRLGSVR